MVRFLFFILVLFVLSGCLGDVASPNYMSDTDMTTTTTETTTTEVQTAEQTLGDTHDVCVAFINLWSCNTTQTNAQSTGLPKPKPKPTPVAATGEVSWLAETCSFFLVAIGCIFWFCVLLWGIGKIFGRTNENSY
jgi:hypothetical protein